MTNINKNELYEAVLWDWDGEGARRAAYGHSHQLELNRRLEKLSVICRAMWTILQERTNISEKELAQRTMEIDLLDGAADGRVSVPARKCAACGRILAPRHERCFYCGGKKLADSVFETV